MSSSAPLVATISYSPAAGYLVAVGPAGSFTLLASARPSGDADPRAVLASLGYTVDLVSDYQLSDTMRDTGYASVRVAAG